MFAKKIRTNTPQKPAQALLILLLTISGGMSLTHEALAQASTATASRFSPALVQSWKDYLKNYPAMLAQYQDAQDAHREAAKPVMASDEKKIDDLAKAYPFLRQDLQAVKDLQQKIGDYMSKHPDKSSTQSLDTSPHIQIAESKDSQTGINIFFLSKSGRLWCGSHGCNMDVYVDTGTGYQKAGSFIVANNIYLTRADKNVFLFAGPPDNPNTVEWILKDHKFTETTPPPPEPKSQAYVEWRDEQKKAGKWPPK